MGYKKKRLIGNRKGANITKDTPIKPHHIEIVQRLKLALYELGDLWHTHESLYRLIPDVHEQTIMAVLTRLIDNGEIERQEFRFKYADWFRPRRYLRLPDSERKRLDELFGKDTFMHEQDVIEFLSQSD